MKAFMKTLKSLFGILTVTLTPCLRVRAAFLSLLAGLCFLTACGSKKSDEATGMGNSRESARQDAVRTLDRKYASYQIVDEDASDWVSGHAQVKDPDRFSMGGRDGHATTQEQVRTYKCTIRVKNAVPRKEGDTAIQSEGGTQVPVVAKETSKASSVQVAHAAVNTTLGQQAETFGMCSSIARLLSYQRAESPKDSESFRDFLLGVGVSDFLKAGAEYDVRIPDTSQTTDSTVALAYILFNKDKTPVNITEMTMTESILPSLESGLNKALRAGWLTGGSSDKLSVFGRENSRDFKSCSAIGVALLIRFDGEAPVEECQGAVAGNGDLRFALIEPGTTLHKEVLATPYFTNIFAAAQIRETEVAKLFIGSWRFAGEDGAGSLLEVGPDHAAKCKDRRQNWVGKYWVQPGDLPEIVFLDAGANSCSKGQISTDGTLTVNVRSEGTGPSGQFRKD